MNLHSLAYFLAIRHKPSFFRLSSVDNNNNNNIKIIILRIVIQYTSLYSQCNNHQTTVVKAVDTYLTPWRVGLTLKQSRVTVAYWLFDHWRDGDYPLSIASWIDRHDVTAQDQPSRTRADCRLLWRPGRRLRPLHRTGPGLPAPGPCPIGPPSVRRSPSGGHVIIMCTGTTLMYVTRCCRTRPGL